MLELTLASIPNDFITAREVVVPPGILSPITKQSVMDARVLPIIRP